MTNKGWPKGFWASGLASGIYPQKGRKDLSLFVSERPAVAAAVFTQNRVKAAPLFVSQQNLRQTRGHAQAILANSGCANACTGKEGMRRAQNTCLWVAKGLRIHSSKVLVASTGPIGTELPLAPLKKGISQLVREKKIGSKPNPQAAAQGILTTDTRVKVASISFSLGNTRVTLWGCAKGAGMIHPQLGGRGATMLAFLLTDVALALSPLQNLLEKVVERTFNRISVDGDTSPNDSVFLLANGSANDPRVSRGLIQQKFASALHQVCQNLSFAIAADGEGATKLIHIFVLNARTSGEARRVAQTVATSNLVKTALYGGDPNWGRVMAAVGRSGVNIKPERVSIRFGDLEVCQQGVAVSHVEEKARVLLQAPRISVQIDLGEGRAWDHYTTCDLTPEYVRSNVSRT